MKHIRNLWNLLKQEISLWKYEKQELVKGICYIVMIAWLFFDRIAFAILLIPYLFVFMKQQRIHKVHREKEKLRKEFREMMISCLLYTSPSRRDPKTSRMPSSA